MDDNDLSYEPMDVDLSSQSACAMDISYNRSNTGIESKLDTPDTDATESNLDFKPEIINELYSHKIQKLTTKSQRTNNNRSLLLFSLTFLLISVIIIQIINFKCSEELNINLISERLTRKIYGQATATSIILQALAAKEKRKLLVFYGGTGVGKTYMTSLILENVLDCNNIYHYTMPGFLQTFSSELLGLLFCKSAIIVLDDLKSSDILTIKEPLQQLIVKSQNLSINITIILVYNCDIVDNSFQRKCNDNFVSDLKNSLTDLDAYKYFIKFETLTEAHLQKCIEDELIDRILSATDFKKVIKNFNVTLDGCKGVYQRMKYLKIV